MRTGKARKGKSEQGKAVNADGDAGHHLYGQNG